MNPFSKDFRYNTLITSSLFFICLVGFIYLHSITGVVSAGFLLFAMINIVMFVPMKKRCFNEDFQ